jgi:hypothetical protein
VGAPILVIVPVLGRPHRVAPLLASLRANTPADLFDVVFVCDPDDVDEHDAIHNCHAPWINHAGGYEDQRRLSGRP